MAHRLFNILFSLLSADYPLTISSFLLFYLMVRFWPTDLRQYRGGGPQSQDDTALWAVYIVTSALEHRRVLSNSVPVPFLEFYLISYKVPTSFYDYDYLIPSSSKPFTFFPVNFYLVHTCKNQSFETQTSLETVSEKWKRNKKRKNSKLNRSQYFKSRAVNLLGIQSLDLLQAIISKSVTLVITNLNIHKTNRSSLMLCSMQPNVKKTKKHG